MFAQPAASSPRKDLLKNLDVSRQRAITVALCSVRMPLAELRLLLLRMDDEKLTIEALRSTRRLRSPTPERRPLQIRWRSDGRSDRRRPGGLLAC